MRLIDNENEIFASYDIRKALIDRIQKHTDISLPKACEAVGIDHGRFFKEYLMEAHPDKENVGSFVSVVSFKNLLTLFGMSIRNVLYLDPKDWSKEHANEIIRERITKLRVTSGKRKGPDRKVQVDSQKTKRHSS